MSWESVPVCYECWRERQPDRAPHRMQLPPLDYCWFCEIPTTDGIYERVEVDSP